MPKQSRVQRKLKPKHRAVKPHFRPLDAARPDNHAVRHAAKKVKRAAHEALMAKQAEEKAAREAVGTAPRTCAAAVREKPCPGCVEGSLCWNHKS